MSCDQKKLTLCACVSRNFIDRKKVARLAAISEACGWDVNVVGDLCEMVEDKSSSVDILAETTITACHERAVKSLLDYCDIKAGTLINLRTDSLDDALCMLHINDSVSHANSDETALNALQEKYENQISGFVSKPGEDAWYPTIDKDVCGECGKCLDFCPFGVYEMLNDRVRVVHPHNCKNNCPACARTCPASAIIFPKYERSPINGGENREENAVQLDTRTLYAKAFRERLEHRRSLTKSFLSSENKNKE